MESSSDNLNANKQKILEFIETKGPSLPVTIASFLRADSLIVSAILAELLGDKKIKLSYMRVGNSPVYFIQGQEFQLDKFAEHLSRKEREAFELLKDRGILEDKKMLPAIRVALRSIKDFSFPLEYNGILYWRFIKLNPDRAVELIGRGGPLRPVPIVQKGIEIDFQKLDALRYKGVEVEKKKTDFFSSFPEGKKKKTDFVQEEGLSSFPVGKKRKVEFVQEAPAGVPSVEGAEGKVVDRGMEITTPVVEVAKPVKLKKGEKSEFVLDVMNFLERNQLGIGKELGFKKKEYLAKIEVNSQLGRVGVYCIAKDKKSINENDLTLALQKSHEEKMPILLISRGEPNKKAYEKLESLGNLVFYKKLE